MILSALVALWLPFGCPLRPLCLCASPFVRTQVERKSGPDLHQAYLDSQEKLLFDAPSPPNERSEISAKIQEEMGKGDETSLSPLVDPNMTSARNMASASTSAPTRPRASKLGILPSSLPAYHKDFMERERARATGVLPDDAKDTPPEMLSQQPRTQAQQEETARRLKPHSRSQMRLDEANRPLGLTPVNPPKKHKPVRWQFGIRSRNAPWEALSCIYKALYKLGATWLLDEGFEQEEDGPK